MTDYLTSAEVAEKLGISERTLSRLLIQTPGLTYLKVGRAIRFRPADIQRLEAALQRETPGTYSRGRTVTVHRVGKKARASDAVWEALAQHRAEKQAAKAAREAGWAAKRAEKEAQKQARADKRREREAAREDKAKNLVKAG